ncbi:MAG: superoxide dismutase family protein [Pseudomonadota bacterium]|jgi:Cu-Zn family superoxide dismutase
MFIRTSLVAAAIAIPSIGAAAAQSAKATVKNADGATIGSIDLVQVSGGVLIKLAAKGLPPGEHAFHVHAVGKCEPPFTSAGGHFNPDNRKHGMMSADGHHAGDMPNLIVPASGEVAVEVVNAAITLDKDKPNSLSKPEGTAFVVHAAADDYKTDPTGNAGGRIACAVVE